MFASEEHSARRTCLLVPCFLVYFSLTHVIVRRARPRLTQPARNQGGVVARRPACGRSGVLAARTGAAFVGDESDGRFQMVWWSQPIHITYPDFAVQDAAAGSPLGPLDQALVIAHFHDSNGVPVAGRWISFSELPDGRFYAQAFQGYTGQELLRTFGEDVAAFEIAANTLGGRRVDFANVTYAFQALPRLPLLAACWLGDEDFPPSYRILFDASASHQLSTDGCAILGSTLTRKLLKVSGKRS